MIKNVLFGTAAAAAFTLAAPAAAQDAPAGEEPMVEPEMGPPPATIDSDGDGTNDAWDRNGDGNADAWDQDGDGNPDALDDDGDGEPDPAPQG